MLLGFSYLYKFVIFYFLIFTVAQNFVILFFLVLLKIGSVGPVDQQINLFSPKIFFHETIVDLILGTVSIPTLYPFLPPPKREAQCRLTTRESL